MADLRFRLWLRAPKLDYGPKSRAPTPAHGHDPYGTIGEATFDDQGLLRVRWSKPHPDFAGTEYWPIEVEGGFGPITDWDRA